MTDARSFLGMPVPFKDYCMVYPPTIKDTLANPNFNKYLALLTISQEDIEDQIYDPKASNVQISEGDIPTPYQYLVILCIQNPIYLRIIKEGFKFFTKQELTFLPEKQTFLLGDLESIILNMKNKDDLPILKPEDYFEFQNAIRGAMGMELCEPYNYDIHPKKRRMLALRRLRDRTKSKQATKQGSFLNNLVSICCMGIGLTPLNIGEMSYAAISSITGKYQMKEKYEIDMKILTSGFCSNKKLKPEYWMQEKEK